MKPLKLIKDVIFLLLVCTLVISNGFAYKMEPEDNPPAVIHQHITKEAKDIWKLAPYELKNKSSSDINYVEIDGTYTADRDDIIIGAAEEDRAALTIANLWRNHYWEPDAPNNLFWSELGDYSKGLYVINGGAFRTALAIWTEEVIPLYLKGEVDESYYWLGRVAHLLQDSTVTDHAHLDCHADIEGLSGIPCIGDDSSLEEFTANAGYYNASPNYYHWRGTDYSSSGPYIYENLINNFDWSNVDSQVPDIKNNLELFRLFWYTSQKTQYFASDGTERNVTYTDINDNSHSWDCSGTGDNNLWKNEGYTSCSDFTTMSQMQQDDPTDSGPYVSAEANALVPHAMKVTAGLYRLFWDAVNIDWPFYHHDIRRTGFTLLKGDIEPSQTDQTSFTLEENMNASYVDLPSIADIDEDGKMELVTVSKLGTNPGSSDSKVFVMEYNGVPLGFVALDNSSYMIFIDNEKAAALLFNKSMEGEENGF